MLDYRAHKLYWLICLPFRVVTRLTFYIAVFFAIIIAQLTSYGILVKIVIAYVAMEAILMAVLLLWGAVSWAADRVFFWLIDVVPAHGANSEEARAIVLSGHVFELNKKFETAIEDWTSEDTRALVSHMNWRARLFFPVRERMEHTVAELQRVHAETGDQPHDLGQKAIIEIRERFPRGKVTWFEKAIVTQTSFNAIVGLALIVLVIGYAIPRGSC